MAETSSKSSPRIAAMAPSPTGTAFCMAWPRIRSSRAASSIVSAPAAQSAEYSPSEWPAMNAASRATTSPASLSSARKAARLVAISAGCALAVSVSSASGPSNTSCESFWPSAASTRANTSRAAGNASQSALPMPTACEPCPGNTRAVFIPFPYPHISRRAQRHGPAGAVKGARERAISGGKLATSSRACGFADGRPVGLRRSLNLSPRLDRGMESHRRDHSQSDEGCQHHDLAHQERRLGLGRRQRVQGRKLLERLRHRDEHVQVERGDRGSDVNPTPLARESKGVERGDSQRQQDERDHSNRARRIEPERRQREAGNAGQDRRRQKDRRPPAGRHSRYQAVQHDEARENSNQTQDDMDLKHRSGLPEKLLSMLA